MSFFRKMSPLFLVLAVALPFAHAEDSFPLRKEAKYADLNFISIDDFAKVANEAVVIDVRSQFEYDTIHVDGAKNISINQMGFASNVEGLRKKADASKKIILYCNGIMCTQSYDAGAALKAEGFANFYVFDGGIGGWAKKFADRTIFMGAKLGDASKLFPPEKVASHQVNYAKVKEMDADGKAVLMDVRENFFRKKVPPLKNLKHMPLSKIIPLLEAGKHKDAAVYFMDDSGKRLPWLQYHLEKYGYTNYFFLKEGLNEALKD